MISSKSQHYFDVCEHVYEYSLKLIFVINILYYCHYLRQLVNFHFRLSRDCVYRFRVRLGSEWESLPRPIFDWLNKKEDLDLRLLLWTGYQSDYDSDDDDDNFGGWPTIPPDAIQD